MSLPAIAEGMSDDLMDRMTQSATDASKMLKAISHEHRLLILCHLASGEKSVSQLEELLAVRQAAVSQQLARLRLEGLVATKRDGKMILYRLADRRAKRLLEVLYELYCAPETTGEA